MRLLICIFVVCVFGVHGDINIHNPRGSNNRLRDDRFERKNANRLFDSQNNNRGGHNVGEEQLYYYGGSKLRIEWANQHSCGDQNGNCEVIIQYMCGENVRDGLIPNTAPTNVRSCRNGNCNTDQRFGMHESFEYFQQCASRERNKGLFIANRAVRQSARSTRQNEKGQRYGYECPEERDYYPYWGPTPWRDIAVFTNNPERCTYYQQESQNVKHKYECVFPDAYWRNSKKKKIVLFGNRRECETSTVILEGRIYRGRWVLRPAHGISPPECFKSQWSRDNHQGNTIGGEFLKYDGTVPNIDEQNCVVRLRYNISTNDFDPWETTATHNSELQPDIIWKRFGLEELEAKRRHYYLRNNPAVDVFNLRERKKNFRLRVALNTAQYGRTFQDRTHTFQIRPRPRSLRDEVIYNVNVRGKRGNIVQVYPSVEYDFVPNSLRMNEGEMVHFQWTGSDTNPRMADGNGEIRTDRSNIVQLAYRGYPKGHRWQSNRTLATNYPIQESHFLGFDWKKTEDLAFLERCTGPDPDLDQKSAYFDLGPQKITVSGSYFYMSTRNNDFSKRSQKAAIHVGEIGYLRLDKGASYRGFKSVTRSGRICQRWDRQTPHRHFFSPENFRHNEVEENFCRNPGGARSKPWCYTTDARTTWEYCDLPMYNGRFGRPRRDTELYADDLVNLPDTDEDTPLQDEL